MTDAPAPFSANAVRGIALKVASVATFVGMSSLIKAAGELPTGQVVFYRSFFAILPIAAYLAWQSSLRTAFHTSRPVGHLARGIVGVTAMSLSFYGLARLPLPEAITISYAQPLIVVIFSAIFLREHIRAYRWTAVAVGMIGVLIVSWPKLSLLADPLAIGRGEALGAVATLLGAAGAAGAMILVRDLVRSEHSGTVVIWFSMTASVLALVTLPFGWATLSWPQAIMLACAGFLGGVAQLLMTEAYRYAEASVVAPFEYTSLVLGIGVGYLVFADVPTLNMLAGGAIVIAAGIFVIFRERQLGLERARARRVSPPV